MATANLKVKSLQAKIRLPVHFPDERVVDAYMHPQVDNSKDKFEFSRPDLQVTVCFTWK
jgi:hypothetical protein